ncbi:MAG: hypothetical protein HY554_11030, partial [Elusimicrobia bacterium]|nr:hypothetical protein [Elusimicrobiota bacterium]
MATGSRLDEAAAQAAKRLAAPLGFVLDAKADAGVAAAWGLREPFTSEEVASLAEAAAGALA